MNYQATYDRIKKLIESNERFDNTDKRIMKTIVIQALWEQMGVDGVKKIEEKAALEETRIALIEEVGK